MNYQMVALDLDGTLTNDRKEITFYTEKILKQYMEAGGTIVLASGRPAYGIYPLAQKLQMNKYGGYILAYNGGQIVDCTSMQTISRKKLQEGMAQRLYKIAKKENVALMTYEGDCIITETPGNYYVKKEAAINKMCIRQVRDFCGHVKFPVTKCLLADEAEHLAAVEQDVKREVGEQCSVSRSEPYFLEVTAPGIDKAAALQYLSNYLSIDRKQMAAFGDGFNDRSMISYVGWGVAMGNAIQEVKAVAKHITLSNEAEGVAVAMEQFVL